MSAQSGWDSLGADVIAMFEGGHGSGRILIGPGGEYLGMVPEGHGTDVPKAPLGSQDGDRGPVFDWKE